MVDRAGIEPATSSVQVTRSNPAELSALERNLICERGDKVLIMSGSYRPQNQVAQAAILICKPAVAYLSSFQFYSNTAQGALSVGSFTIYKFSR